MVAKPCLPSSERCLPLIWHAAAAVAGNNYLNHYVSWVDMELALCLPNGVIGWTWGT